MFKTIAFVLQLVVDVWVKIDAHRQEIKAKREEKSKPLA